MPETGNVVCVEDFFATIESYLNKEHRARRAARR